MATYQGEVCMRTITRADSDYDQARDMFNQAIDRHPSVIARCRTSADVAEALAHAATKDFAVAVRSTGHSVSGLSTNDGGLVIDVSPMKTIEIDHRRRTARVGAGVTWESSTRRTKRTAWR